MRVRCPVLVGRSAELAVFTAALAAARRGEGRAVFVSGEAGVGKTRLVREVVAAAGDTTVVVGRCVEGDLPSPLRPLAEATMSLTRAAPLPQPRGARPVRGRVGQARARVGSAGRASRRRLRCSARRCCGCCGRWRRRAASSCWRTCTGPTRRRWPCWSTCATTSRTRPCCSPSRFGTPTAAARARSPTRSSPAARRSRCRSARSTPSRWRRWSGPAASTTTAARPRPRACRLLVEELLGRPGRGRAAQPHRVGGPAGGAAGAGRQARAARRGGAGPQVRLAARGRRGGRGGCAGRRGGRRAARPRR